MSPIRNVRTPHAAVRTHQIRTVHEFRNIGVIALPTVRLRQEAPRSRFPELEAEPLPNSDTIRV